MCIFCGFLQFGFVRLVYFAAQFFAHSHKDDFRLQMSETETDKTHQEEETKSFVLLAPAISPVYHNNPAFRVVSLDTEKQALLDYSQHYMDLVMATGEGWRAPLAGHSRV